MLREHGRRLSMLLDVELRIQWEVFFFLVNGNFYCLRFWFDPLSDPALLRGIIEEEHRFKCKGNCGSVQR